MNVKSALEYIAIFVVFCVIFSLVGVVSVSAADVDIYHTEPDTEILSFRSDFGTKALAVSVTTFPEIPIYNSSTYPTGALQYGNNEYLASSSPNTYAFYVPYSSTVYYTYGITDNIQNVSVHYSTSQFKKLTNTSGSYYYNTIDTAVSVFNDSIPVFSSLNDAISAFETFINTPAESPVALNYSLPPGNAIYIQVPSGTSYTLNCRMPESVLGTNHYPGNNQAVTLVQSLPTGGSAPSSPLIPWAQTGALSYLGLSRNATYSATVASSGYLCIVNPLYYSGTANGPYEFLSNGAIDISVDSQTGFWVYPLDSTLGFTSGLGLDVSTDILDTPYTGSIDPDTGEITWEDSDGGSSAPTTGGGNLVDTSETIFDFLRNISQELSTFLKGPVSAIQTVVSAIRDFMSSFTQLYTWLPSPVYNLITSALMIALTIGVIKIFI